MTTTTAPPVRAASVDLANLLVLDQLLKKDEEFDAREREERDRDIRRKLSASRSRRSRLWEWMRRIRRKPSASRSLQQGEQILFWMQDVSASDAKVREDAECIRDAVWNLNVVLFGIGLLLGGIAALGIFFYDGTNRVNVLDVILVFVVLQPVLIVVFAIAARSQDTRRASLAALARLAARQAVLTFGRALPEAGRHRVLEVLDIARHRERHYSTVVKWLVLSWSQSMAIAFNVAALVTAFALVASTDLAFGWSTTWQISPTFAQRIAAGIATPWVSVVPSAVPDEELVEISRHFRMSMGLERVDAATAVRLGGWWSFILLCMLFYGLLPRLATFTFTHWMLRGATRRAMLRLDGAKDVLNRLKYEDFETQGAKEDTKIRPGPVETFRSDSDAIRVDGASAVIDQSDVPVPIKTHTEEEEPKAAPRPVETVESDTVGRRVGGASAVINTLKEPIERGLKVLKAHRALRRARREPLVQAAEGLTVDRANRGEKAARHIAKMLEEILTLSEERKLSPDDDAKIELQKLKERFKEELLRIENDCRENVQDVYSCNRLLRREDDDEILNADLFSKDTWSLFGLGRGRLAQHFRGRMLRCGPIRNLNVAFVLIGRARDHHMLIARHTHACRDELDLHKEPDSKTQAITPLTMAQKKELMKLFRKFQKNAKGSETRVEAMETLTERLAGILKDDAQNTKTDPS